MPAVQSDLFERSIQRKEIGSLYLLDGPENWLKERVVKNIVDALLSDDARAFNLDKFDATTDSAANIVSSLQSLPFLADRRVVIVQSAEEFSAAESRLVAEVLSNLSKTTCALFLYQGKANMREEVPAAILSQGIVVTYWTPFPNMLPRWISEEAKRRGKTLTFDAAQALADACADLQEVSNELDKLFLFVGKKTAITLDDVEQHGLPDQAGDFYALEAAVYERNLGAGLEQGKLLAEMGVRAEMIFPMFERSIRQVLLGHEQMRKNGWSSTELLNSLRIRSKTQQANILKALKAYQPAELVRGISKLTNAEMDLKTGRLSSEMAVSLFLVGFLGKDRN